MVGKLLNLYSLTFVVLSLFFLSLVHWLGGLGKKIDDLSGRLFHLSAIEFSENEFVEEKELRELLKISSGVAISDLSIEDIRKSLTSHRWISDAHFAVKSSPNRLVISVVERQPWLVLQSKHISWALSKSFKILDELDKVKYAKAVVMLSQLPRLNIDKLIEEEDVEPNVLENKLRPALRSIKCIEGSGGFGYEIYEQEVSDKRSLNFNLDRDGQLVSVIFPIDANIDCQDKLSQLNLVLEDLARKREAPVTIDLRFDSQVVVRK